MTNPANNSQFGTFPTAPPVRRSPTLPRTRLITHHHAKVTRHRTPSGHALRHSALLHHSRGPTHPGPHAKPLGHDVESSRASNEDNRTRMAHGGRANAPHGSLTFINPYPWMSAPEALVHVSLEDHNIPFSWRYFDGYSPTFTQLLGNVGYQPEFTLREYNTVILIIGGFFGTLPGVVDKLSLAKVTLEADGWKVVVLFESEIRVTSTWDLLVPLIPGLGSITGPLRPNPYGHPDLLVSSRKHHFRQLHPRLKTFSIRESLITGDHHVARSPSKFSHRNTDGGRSRSQLLTDGTGTPKPI